MEEEGKNTESGEECRGECLRTLKFVILFINDQEDCSLFLTSASIALHEYFLTEIQDGIGPKRVVVTFKEPTSRKDICEYRIY